MLIHKALNDSAPIDLSQTIVFKDVTTLLSIQMFAVGLVDAGSLWADKSVVDGLGLSNPDDQDAVEMSGILAGGLCRLAFGGLSCYVGGECEQERAPGAKFGFHPYASGVQLDYLFHDRKTNARTCDFLP